MPDAFRGLEMRRERRVQSPDAPAGPSGAALLVGRLLLLEVDATFLRVADESGRLDELPLDERGPAAVGTCPGFGVPDIYDQAVLVERVVLGVVALVGELVVVRLLELLPRVDREGAAQSGLTTAVVVALVTGRHPLIAALALAPAFADIGIDDRAGSAVLDGLGTTDGGGTSHSRLQLL